MEFNNQNVRTLCVLPCGSNKMNAFPLKPKRKPRQVITPWRMTEYLSEGNYAWLKLRDKYADIPYIVINLPIEEAKHIAHIYTQPSFIWAEVQNNDLQDINFSVYCHTEDQTDYILTDAFVIPYSDIIDACNRFNSAVNQHKSESAQYRLEFDHLLNESLRDNAVSSWRYLCRALLYRNIPITR